MSVTPDASMIVFRTSILYFPVRSNKCDHISQQMSLFEISKIQRTTGIPKMSLFEIGKVQRTKVQMFWATKQPDKELSEGPDHD